MKSYALWHQSASISEILEHPLPEDLKGKLLIKSLFSMISQGTEGIIARGLMPPDIQEKMRVPYMEGSFLLPCKYGYSLVGKVIRGPDDLRDKLVHVMHPHQDIAWVDASSVYILPDGIPPHRAVLACNLETAVNALWDSEISIGDSVLVTGFGIIGALIALLASDVPGIKVAVFEINPKRRQFAAEMGFNLLSESDPRSFDAAFNTTADGDALQLCIDRISYEGQVTEVSFYGSKAVSLMLGGNFHSSRKKIVVSQVSHIPGKKLNRWDPERRKDLVFELLKNGRYDLLARNIIPFRDAPVFFDKIRKGQVDEISAIIKYT